MLLLVTLIVATACSNDDKAESLNALTVQLTSTDAISDFSNFQITVTELKSGTTFKDKADAQGKATFNLPLGAYNIVAEDMVDGASTMYGHTENLTVAGAASKVEIKVTPLLASIDKSFVLDELYFNGDNNGDWNYVYYESYLTIRNVSDRALYADGLSIAICGNFNSLDEKDSPMAEYLKKDTIVISQLYTIPGDGRKYKVEPGKSLVLAHSAINHKFDNVKKVIDKSKIHSIDLSGADLEFYIPGTMTTDNPEVENMLVDYSAHEAFNWGYTGNTPIMLVRLSKAERAKLVGSKVKMDMPLSMGTMKLDYLLLPVSSVIDGVETGSKDAFMMKVLPDRVDRSAILINTGFSGFDGQFIHRKQITNAAGTATVQDTNNSADDFEIIVHGQKSYPKK